MIERIIVKNFKGIKEADISFHDKINVIVGNNGVGKSTLIESISLALGYGIGQLEITQYLFHESTWQDFESSKTLPEIIIELYFNKNFPAEYSGKNNSLSEYSSGIRLRIACDSSYLQLFNEQKEQYKHIPCEFYNIERCWFSGDIVKQFLVPYTPWIIDSSSNSFNNKANQLATRLISYKLSEPERVQVKGCLRTLREHFEGNDKVGDINSSLNDKIKDISPDFKLTVDLTTKMAWNTILCPVLKEIPFSQIGLGDQCVINTLLSIDSSSNETDKKERLLVIEEPESHLSHTKMYELLNYLGKFTGQMFVSTHSSYVANKLSLNNLIVLGKVSGKICSQKISDLEDYDFFAKVPNYPTLRVALCEKAILVEGPTDEMVVLYYFMKEFGCHPFAKGIELISVGGVVFKHFALLGAKLNKRIAVITDNDGHSIEEVKTKRNLPQKDTVKLFSESNSALNTLEPAFVNANANNIDCLSQFIRGKKINGETTESLSEYMEKHKTEWAQKLLENDSYLFDVPQYIKDAINWLIDEDK
ncbi:AAA family ATPase [Bacteroides xylanisolvens]|uniref:ATP-dependent nuclease n=1 Tax=Bacteroides xylanisolvens TaxID=371601 RepID=UPI0012600677|nr:AAA family ATPase [Bacteroides xylanisolvens]KAB6443023.1 AAA family ATPase [Bacteroides xylanisolvens]KAB6458743.1 AAA family ATPase [Bacteroides xylanisolvens]